MIDRIIEFSLQNRTLVVLGMIVVIIAGIFVYRSIPVDAFPDISPIMVPVYAEAHGMSPEEVERLISYPIESSMNGLPGVTRIKSTSAFGLAVVYVYFEDNIDIYFARQLVSERLVAAMADLPDMDEPPGLGPISTGLGQIFIYYLTAEEGIDTGGMPLDMYLRDLNDRVVKYHLQTVPGVTEVLSMGGNVLQYQIKPNPRALLEYDVSMEDIIDAVNSNNRNAGGQFIVTGSEEQLVRGIGLLTSLDDIRRLPLKSIDGIPVRISDIALVELGSEIRRGVVTNNGD
ncbi:MAG: efflux RND transporter permease subunit, partial [Candidatus Sabulitectum sp.]|nr:efflux RND transporter permease subunit [Candidatus Sabulitectum sp.]